MTQLIKARYLNSQDRNYKDELMIIAGGLAYARPSRDKLSQWRKLSKDDVPILVGEKELKKLPNVQIVPEDQEIASVHQAGSLSAQEIEGIIYTIAKNSKVKTLRFYDQALQMTDYSEKVAKVRADNDDVNKIVVKALPSQDEIREDDKPSEKAKAFRRWFNKLLSLHEVSKEIYSYNGKIWHLVGDMELSRAAVQFFEEHGLHYSAEMINRMLSTLKIQIPLMGESSSDFIAFNNGLLNRNTGEFLPHDPIHCVTACIPHDYQEEKQDTAVFDDWLEFISDGDKIKEYRILAALYAILTNRYNWQIFLEVTGHGGSGKSIFAHIARLLAGEQNTTSSSLIQLDDEGARAKLFNKTLILCPDQTKYTGDGSALKAISGGDLVSMNPKYKDRFDEVIKALILVVNNEPAQFTERAGGIDRRRVIFQFDKIVPKSQRDPFLMDKIAAEAGGIIQKLLNTFKDPNKARDALDEQMKSKEALKVKMSADHLMAFCGYFTTKEEIGGLFIGNGNMSDSKSRDALIPRLYSLYRGM